jgi:hypothetical protein
MTSCIRGRHSAFVLGLVVTGSTLVPAPAGGVGEPELVLSPYTAQHDGFGPASVGIGDVTGDGRADVLTTSSYTNDYREWSLFVYAQRADGTLADPKRFETSGRYYSEMSLGVADLDGDGDDDAAVGSTAGVDVFLQGPNGLVLDDTVGGFTAGDLTTSDMDGDGVAEIIVSGGPGLQVLRRDAGTYTAELAGPPGQYGNEVEVADVTGDARPDVVVIGDAGIEVSRQIEDGTFEDPVAYSAGDAAHRINGLATADVNGDSRADVVVSYGGNVPSSKVIIRLQQPDGTLGAQQALRSYDIPEAITGADVSGDGLDDVVTLHGGWSAMGVYRQQNGALAPEQRYEIPGQSHYDPKAIAIGDISGDGRPDIVLADAGLVIFRSRLPYADLRLSVDDRNIRYGERFTATIALKAAEGRTVSLYAKTDNGRRTIATGRVNRLGILRVPVTLNRNSRLVATYTGDDSFGPTQASVSVKIGAKLRTATGNTYGRAGRYHLVHDRKDPILGVRLFAPDGDQCIGFAFQVRRAGSWYDAGIHRCSRTDDSGRAGIRITGVPKGTDLRVRARFTGSSVNGAARTSWVYYRVTA